MKFGLTDRRATVLFIKKTCILFAQKNFFLRNKYTYFLYVWNCTSAVCQPEATVLQLEHLQT